MASPITVTATLQDPSGTALQGNAFVRFRLRNFAGYVPQISGTSILCETQYDAVPNGSGMISQTLWGNSNIVPFSADSTTYYTVEFWNNGRITSSGNYIFDGNTNLNTASPVNTPPPPPGFELVLENNGALNSSQSTLNIENTDGSIVITDEGGGTLNLVASTQTPTFGTAGYGGFFSAGFPLNNLYQPNTSGYAITDNNNQVNVYQFALSAEWVIRRISAYVNTASGSGGTASFGIYSYSGAKLIDSGGLPWTSATQGSAQSVAITAVTLPPGVYYFAQSASSVTFEAQGWGLGSQALDNMVNAFGSVKVGQAANPAVGGVLPATLGTITADSLYVNMSAVFFGV